MSFQISHLLPSVLSSLVGFSLKRNTHSSIRRDLAIRRITPRPQGKKVNSWLTLHARSPRRVNFRQREGFKLIYSAASIVAAFLCASGIGMIFGFLPARNAARLDPVEALSRE